MAVQIEDRCVRCGACEWECPAEAISPGPSGPTVQVDLCTECYGFFGESQCIVVCPVDAIAVLPEPIGDLRQRHQATQAQPPLNTWIWRRIGREATDRQTRGADAPRRTQEERT